MSLGEATIEEKRQTLLQYVAYDKNGHDYFRLNDGSHFEGYIVEVRETSIIFEWAIGPFESLEEYYAHLEPLEIPIDGIDIHSLK
jgi:hypothetical protein